MDINFIIFFIFIMIVLIFIKYLEDEGMLLIVFALFMAAIFANTQSSSPIFFDNSAYLGWGQLFNTFWLILAVICLVMSFFAANKNGLFKRMT